MKQKINKTIQGLRSWLTKRNLLIAGVVMFASGLAFAYWPRTIEFSYAGESCVKQLSVFPGTLQSSSDDKYSLEVGRAIGPELLGLETCAKPVGPPEEGETRLSFAPFGLSFLAKTYIIKTPTAPIVSTQLLEKPIPAKKPVVLSLSTGDEIFKYHLSSEQGRVACSTRGRAVSCDIAKLELTQGQTHEISLERTFGEKEREVIATRDVEVLPAVKVEEASIAEGQTIYDKPQSFEFQFDKELESAKVELARIEGEALHKQPVKTEVSAQKVIAWLDDELARGSLYRLKITDVEATDGSTLDKDYEVQFELSGGPKVIAVSVGASGVDPNAAITLQLDQPLKPNQDVAKLVSFTGGGATISAQGDKIYVKLGNLGRCTNFSVNVAKGLVSQHDIVSEEEWKFNSRVRCHTIATIGHSVQGRPINAYYFGSGSQTILFTGAIHGSELSSKYIMDAWISELETRATEVPAGRQIVVVPMVSPDSVAVASRYNSRGINLNRNFPTHNWVSDIGVSGGRVEEGAGGSAPLSEPESAALARFTEQLNPRFVVTYHSTGSLVNGNDVGIANTLGPQYSRMTGYRYVPNAQTNAVFGVTMTGTYEDWLAERGTAAILIELNTHTGYHFAQNRAAMWAMVRG